MLLALKGSRRNKMVKHTEQLNKQRLKPFSSKMQEKWKIQYDRLMPGIDWLFIQSV